jgi:tetratricopeptide (TPR) repeat protein
MGWARAWWVLVLLPRLAAAQPVDDQVERARVHLRAGIAYYDEARYEDAAREMEAAYQLKPLADLQYNLAQCYERLNRIGDAVGAYHKYLDGGKQLEDRAAVEARIANLEQRQRAEAAGQAPTPLAPGKVVFKTIVIYREAPPKPGRGARIAAYGVGVLALASLGVGISFSLLAAQNANRVTDGGSLTMPVTWSGRAQDAETTGKTQAIVADVSYAVAGAAAVAAVGLFLLGRKIDAEAPKLTLAPSLGPGGGGFALAGRY